MYIDYCVMSASVKEERVEITCGCARDFISIGGELDSSFTVVSWVVLLLWCVGM